MREKAELFLGIFAALPVKKLLSLSVGSELVLGGESLRMWIKFQDLYSIRVKCSYIPKDADESSVCFEIMENEFLSPNHEEERHLELGMIAVEPKDAFNLKKHRKLGFKIPSDNSASLLISESEALLLKWSLDGVLSLKLLERLTTEELFRRN